MELRPLGATGLQVSVLGLGTVKLGRNRGVKYPGGEGFALPNDDSALTLFRTAADLGINLIDTAPAYGQSEERIGSIMHRAAWIGGRSRWVICTKVGEEFDEQTGESSFNFAPEHAIMSVERSLRRMQLDVLDLVLVHSDGRDDWIIQHAGTLDALRELKHRGLIRSFGMSTKTVDGGLHAIREAPNWGGACDVVMVTYNPKHRADAVTIDAACHRNRGVLIKKALGSGHLSEIAPHLPHELKIQDLPPVQACLRFAAGRAGVSSVILGTLDPQHLAQNAAFVRI